MFDYFYNSKTVPVTLYCVKSYDLQEKFTIKGEIYHKNNVNYIKKPVIMPKGIKEGAYARVSILGETYEGYLKELEILNDEKAIAYVSVVSEKELFGVGEAQVYGSILSDVILVPEKYVFKDESGKDSVMIARDGYVVKRNIKTGTLKIENKVEVCGGLLPDEKIVANHKEVKTGDKYE